MSTKTEIEEVESILPAAIKEKIEEAIMKQDDNLPETLPEEKKALKKAVAEIDIKDRNSVITFGSSAQEKLDEISNRMLDGVKSQETGAAGNALNNMVAKIRGFDMDKLNPNRKLSWWDKLLGRAKPLAVFLQQYEEVRDHIDVISNDLEKHKSKLIKDVVSLDKLYEANLDYFHKLELYIKAGEIKLQEFNEKILPKYEKGTKDEDMLAVQNLKDMRAFRDDLERRVHDLRLSRQVAMQALPSIRLIQENDKSLINKIGSTLVNTVPLWRNQLAQTVTIFRSHDAATAIKEATDLTNDLLEKNAEGLREANAEVRRQMERGVFDIESIKKANNTLIETLNDSLRISEEGKAARKKAVIELEKTEAKLKEALLAVKAKAEAVGHTKLHNKKQNKNKTKKVKRIDNVAFDWLFGQAIDVIDWTDDTHDTMVWRFPRQGNEIKYGAKLTVRESQLAVFVNEGEIADVLGPGTYELETNNLPILTNLQHWDHGFKSPFKAEIYFINTKRFTDLKWGTKNPIMLRDPEFEMVRLRAFGTYEIRITDPVAFLKEIVGTDGHFTTDEIDDQLSNLITSKLAVVLGKDDTAALDMAANYEEFGKFIRDGISPYLDEYGLELTKMLVENISLPDDVQKALDRRTSRAITGDLDENLKYQAGESLGDPSTGGMGDMVGMGAGIALGQQMADSMRNGSHPDDTPPPPPDIKHYYISIDGKSEGPFDLDTMKKMVADGRLTRKMFIWREDLDGWREAEHVLGGLFPPLSPGFRS